jgi:hypothetical protein
MVRVIQIATRRVITGREMTGACCGGFWVGRRRGLPGFSLAPGRGSDNSRHGQLLGEFASIHCHLPFPGKYIPDRRATAARI